MGRQRYTGGKQSDAGRESGKVKPPLRSPKRGLPQVLGNRMVTHLLGEERIQAKSRDDASADPLEHEADQAAASVAAPEKPMAGDSPPSAAAPKVAGPALLVDDDSESIQLGQMSKTDFLSELR